MYVGPKVLNIKIFCESKRFGCKASLNVMGGIYTSRMGGFLLVACAWPSNAKARLILSLTG